MTEKPPFSPTERIAFDALRRFDANIKTDDQVRFYDVIENYGGGTLALAEFTDTNDPEDNHTHEFQVLVQGQKAYVFNDWHAAAREGGRRPNFISQLSSTDTFTAVLTMVLVFSFLLFTWDHIENEKASAGKILGAALTTMIGFWFGRQTR